MQTLSGKQALRKVIRQLKSSYTQEELHAMSLLVIHQLLLHPRFVNAHTIVFYHSLPDEVDTRDAISRLVEMGKEVLLPAVITDAEVELRVYRDAKDLQEGAFRIMEPCGVRFDKYEDIDIVIVPGMAFTADGRRLGRGKGYYDRLLGKMPNAYKIGLCFPFQLVDDIPCEPHDIKMNEVITAS